MVAFVLLFGTSAEGPGDGWSPGKPRKLQVEASQIGQGNSVNKKQKKKIPDFYSHNQGNSGQNQMNHGCQSFSES